MQVHFIIQNSVLTLLISQVWQTSFIYNESNDTVMLKGSGGNFFWGGGGRGGQRHLINRPKFSPHYEQGCSRKTLTGGGGGTL